MGIYEKNHVILAGNAGEMVWQMKNHFLSMEFTAAGNEIHSSFIMYKARRFGIFPNAQISLEKKKEKAEQKPLVL